MTTLSIIIGAGLFIGGFCFGMGLGMILVTMHQEQRQNKACRDRGEVPEGWGASYEGNVKIADHILREEREKRNREKK